MIGPRQREHLHAWLDGALPPAELSEFEVRLKADPALAAEAARLRELAATLEVLGRAEEPQGLVREVMQQIAAVSGRPGAARAPRPESWRHRLLDAVRPVPVGSVARGFLWTAAALGVAAIVATRWLGSPVPDATRGTVGVTKITPADADVLAFLEGDTLRQIRANTDLRGLMADPGLAAALGNATFREALLVPRVAEALADAVAGGSWQTVQGHSDLRAALEDPVVRRALASAELRVRLQTPGGRAAFVDPLLKVALAHPGFPGALASGQLLAALNAVPAPPR